MTSPAPTRGLLMIVGVTLMFAPLAAAHEGCADHPVLVDHYLLKDANGKLRLSYLAPSAANTTRWSVEIPAGKSINVDLEMPAPAFLINEDIDVAGHVWIGVFETSEGPLAYNPLHYQHPDVRISLVEGERSVVLGSTSYGGSFDLKGSYPGHGKGAAPHTHAAGNDAGRGLYTSDILIRFAFAVYDGGLPVAGSLPHSSWRFDVGIDGKSFLRLAKAGEGPAPEPPEPAPPATAQNETEPADNETGNSTEVPESGPSGGGDTETQSSMALPVGATGGLALAGLSAGVGVALLGWRRGRRQK